jgi:hypothetical protein
LARTIYLMHISRLHVMHSKSKRDGTLHGDQLEQS